MCWRIGEGCKGATPPSTMNLLSWNCQGLGNPWAVNGLKCVIRREVPKVVDA
ncbi:hypothetical protein GBA52_009634 [Prunus armeniaca]|nr:hypothetical protein GBA52_009634 [Prunus armeniaca]